MDAFGAEEQNAYGGNLQAEAICVILNSVSLFNLLLIVEVHFFKTLCALKIWTRFFLGRFVWFYCMVHYGIVINIYDIVEDIFNIFNIFKYTSTKWVKWYRIVKHGKQKQYEFLTRGKI